MKWEMIFTHVSCAQSKHAKFVSYMFTRALTVYTQGMMLSN